MQYSTVRHAGNGKRGNGPVEPATDTSDQRNVMTSRGMDYDTPTRRRYHYHHREQQQQQQSDDQPRHISSPHPYTDVRRLNTARWNPQGRQSLLQKLLVSSVVQP